MSIGLTGRELVTRALRTINVVSQNEAPSAANLQAGFVLLNELVDSWAIKALTIPTVNRQVYDLDGTKGGPDDPYTYGPGGDWDTGTAERPPTIQDANLILNSSTPPVEIPLAVLTVDMNAATPIKTLTNSLPVTLYYNDSVPLGQVFLWPVPTDAANQIALYVPVVMPQFRTVDTNYVCPPGYLKAFRLNLALAMTLEFATPPEILAMLPSQAREAMNAVEASNVQMGDLTLDPGYTPQIHGTYVIQTDQGA